MEKENNKLIAEFMGTKIGEDNYSWRPGCIEKLREEHLAYHKEWGWLMPVVEKIETINCDGNSHLDIKYIVSIEATYCIISAGGEAEVCFCDWGKTKIESCYHACVEFIKMYNKNELL